MYRKNKSVKNYPLRTSLLTLNPLHPLSQAELEAMKALVASLQANQNNGAVASSGGGSNEEAERMIAELQAKLAEKQSDLAHSLGECSVSCVAFELLFVTLWYFF